MDVKLPLLPLRHAAGHRLLAAQFMEFTITSAQD
jgi:hypothetical protein